VQKCNLEKTKKNYLIRKAFFGGIGGLNIPILIEKYCKPPEKKLFLIK